MENEEIKKNEKNEEIYICQLCDYKCSYLSDWNRHIVTRKHLVSHSGNKMENEEIKKNEYNNFHKCSGCDKIYKSMSGLWKHKKMCNNIMAQNFCSNDQSDIKYLTNLVLDVVKQNQELTNKLVDVCNKNNSNTNISNNNINSHNKSFNLNFFLNETCKDAMNIMDFVNSIKIQLTDLENFGNLGYVQGISKIIVNNLNLLDETKRPVHCADSKREVMYIKDDNKWEKENEDKAKMRKMIKYVTHKNTKLFKEFKEKYPGCEKSDSKYSDQYDKLIVEAFGGKGDNDIEKEDKIIRNIAKKVTIDKTILH